MDQRNATVPLAAFWQAADVTKGATFASAVQAARDRIAVHRAEELPRSAKRRSPSKMAKASLRAEIDALAAAGQPGIGARTDRAGRNTSPTANLTLQLHGVGAGRAGGEALNALALVAYLASRHLLEMLNSQIDEAADDAAAMTPEQAAQSVRTPRS